MINIRSCSSNRELRISCASGSYLLAELVGFPVSAKVEVWVETGDAAGLEAFLAEVGAAVGSTSGSRGDALVMAPLRWLLSAFLVLGVRGYQTFLRPFLPSVCRFTPSCSEYFILAVQKYGPVRGAAKGMARICRCGPWHPGGHDPP